MTRLSPLCVLLSILLGLAGCDSGGTGNLLSSDDDDAGTSSGGTNTPWIHADAVSLSDASSDKDGDIELHPHLQKAMADFPLSPTLHITSLEKARSQ